MKKMHFNKGNTQRKEAYMLFVKVATNLPHDPKVWRFAQALDISVNESMGMVIRLWVHAYQHLGNGDITHMPAKELARVMTWEGDEDLLRNALLDALLVDDNGVTVEIHNWRERWGTEKQKSAAALKQQRYRERKKAKQNAALDHSEGPYAPSRIEVTRDVTCGNKTLLDRDIDKEELHMQKVNGKKYEKRGQWTIPAKRILARYSELTGRTYYKPDLHVNAIVKALKKGLSEADGMKLVELAAADPWRQGEGKQHGTPVKLFRDKTIEHYLGGLEDAPAPKAEPEPEPELDEFIREMMQEGYAVRRDRARELMQQGTVADAIQQLGAQTC